MSQVPSNPTTEDDSTPSTLPRIPGAARSDPGAHATSVRAWLIGLPLAHDQPTGSCLLVHHSVHSELIPGSPTPWPGLHLSRQGRPGPEPADLDRPGAGPEGFDTEEEAVVLANGTDYALIGTVLGPVTSEALTGWPPRSTPGGGT